MKSSQKKIVSSGGDIGVNHRADFKHCPSCDHPMINEDWESAAIVLVIEPAVIKTGCVSVVSECLKCFERSWVHASMGGFYWNEAWPEAWKKAVKEREATVKLAALREWGAALCHNCRHLTSGTVDHHAWRHCVRGSGPVTTECGKFEQV